MTRTDIRSPLRDARLASGLSQSELGERMGVHFSTVAKFEKGQRKLSLEMAHKASAALGVHIEQISGWSPQTSKLEDAALRIAAALERIANAMEAS